MVEAARQQGMEVSTEELQAEQQEIESSFRSLRFAQKVRLTSLQCFKACGGAPSFPFRIDQDALVGKQHHCFGDCLNVNFESGPFLKDLGDIPEGAIPKKFVWAHGISQ